MIESGDQVKRIFENDVRDKKRTARGVYGMASRKKGFKGAVRFPYEMMSRKERREYTKGGDVIVYNLYERIEDVPSFEEINRMEIDEGHRVIEILRKKFSVRNLIEYWGVKNYDVYGRLFKKYEIKTRGIKDNDQVNKMVKGETNEGVEVVNMVSMKESDLKQIVEMARTAKDVFDKNMIDSKSDGFSIKLNGEFKGKQIEDRVLGLMGTLDKGGRYRVSIRIEELEGFEEKANE